MQKRRTWLSSFLTPIVPVLLQGISNCKNAAVLLSTVELLPALCQWYVPVEIWQLLLKNASWGILENLLSKLKLPAPVVMQPSAHIILFLDKIISVSANNNQNDIEEPGDINITFDKNSGIISTGNSRVTCSFVFNEHLTPTNEQLMPHVNVFIIFSKLVPWFILY